jgi:hypothetical protein
MYCSNHARSTQSSTAVYHYSCMGSTRIDHRLYCSRSIRHTFIRPLRKQDMIELMKQLIAITINSLTNNNLPNLHPFSLTPPNNMNTLEQIGLMQIIITSIFPILNNITKHDNTCNIIIDNH